ncbi:MAG TPA: ATP-binding cassette domain-containing protein [Candidatus Sulfotelmatobacter sp.]|nr:ATP-binding cassette domain-containing protein [Candidatus Sulfotelmatobacter sp.]
MLQVRDVVKSYDGRAVVNRVSFEVQPGEIFALLGPNGAGKTTLIRMITDILRPDSGEILLEGRPVGAERSSRIAYLPEERGLYRKIPVLDALAYYGELKGMRSRVARAAAMELLTRFGLETWAKKQVQALSKGMQQKVQLCTALIGEPRLLILDEPFSGLDPLNVQLFEDVLGERRRAGSTVLLSTHQMNKVEQLCDRALLINRGHMVMYGSVRELRRQYAEHAVLVEAVALPETIPGVRRAERVNGATKLVLESEAGPSAVLRSLVSAGVAIESYTPAEPPLEDIFVHVVTQGIGLDEGRSGAPTVDELHPAGGAS